MDPSRYKKRVTYGSDLDNVVLGHKALKEREESSVLSRRILPAASSTSFSLLYYVATAIVENRASYL